MKLRDVDSAFENAIKKGLQSVEDWMYMYSDDKMDYFKNVNTREYQKFLYEEE